MRDIFDRLSGGKSVDEVELSELLLDPVTVDLLDTLTCFNLPVSVALSYILYISIELVALK